MKQPSHTSTVPFACLIGDISMVRALGIRGIPVALATKDVHGKGARSRYCQTVIRTPDWTVDPDGAIARLIEWARAQAERPVLFYQADPDLLAVSRSRESLAPWFRFVLPDAGLVEALTDKALFVDMALAKGLRIPATMCIGRDVAADRELDRWDRFPCVVKPVMRLDSWYGVAGAGRKALRIESRAELDRLLTSLQGNEGRFLLQAAVEGGEENVVSYHAYVRPDGDTVVEFTGRKIRTCPRRYGLSTYLEITADPEVAALGREIVRRLGFSGVLKIDFKRDARDGELYVLEINPRFNLWHHPGTVAGAAIPEAVYRDCVEGPPERPSQRARPGVRWMVPVSDSRALREYRAAGQLTLARWLYEVLTVDVNEGFQLSDPLPMATDLALLLRRSLRAGRTKGTWSA
jgi:predicted ATP-grasp superfamily ATP-dependent carboligase